MAAAMLQVLPLFVSGKFFHKSLFASTDSYEIFLVTRD